MYKKPGLFLLSLLLTSNFLVAQFHSRSGFPAPAEPQALRMFPCGGSATLYEGFSAGSLPVGWKVRDIDNQNLAPQIDTLYKKGWHIIRDFKTAGNTSIASPSWYDNDSIAADDWLILPATQVGNNTCFSWFAYSQDRFFAESYEVLISLDAPSGPDDILQNFDTLTLVKQEGFFINYRSVNLSDVAGGKYKNKQAYIAFRHTSLNKFMLVLDDIRIAEVENEDLGVHPVEMFDIDPGDSTFFTGGIRNYGADTVTISGDDGLKIAYSVNGGAAVLETIFLNDSLDFNIAPNDTLRFKLKKSWKSPSGNKVYYICLWTDWPGDQNSANDTFCIRQGVGVDITAVDQQLQADGLQIFPNPVSENLQINWQYASSRISLSVFDLMGKQLIQPISIQGQNQYNLPVAQLPKGIYILRLRDAQGKQIAKRFIKN